MKYIFLAIWLLLKVIACLFVSALFYSLLVSVFSIHFIWFLNFKEARTTFDMYFSERKNESNPKTLCDVFVTPYDYFFGKPVTIESEGVISFF